MIKPIAAIVLSAFFPLSQDWQLPKTWLLFMPVWVDALLATARTL